MEVDAARGQAVCILIPRSGDFLKGTGWME